MSDNQNRKEPAEITKALSVISNLSKSWPMMPPAENGRYAGYGPPNRVDDGVRLRDVWSAISKRRWMIVLITLLVTAITSVMLARKLDIYSAEAQVQVDTEGPTSGLTGGKNGNIILGYGQDPTYFNTQLQLISKAGLLRRVVKTLDLEHNQEFLQAQAGDTTWQRLLRTFGLPARSATPVLRKSDTGKLLIGKDVAAADSTDLEEAARLNPFVSTIQGGLKVEPVKEERLQYTETRLISIRFIHANPIVAAKVANAIAETFVLSNLEQKTQFTSTTGDFLQKRIAELQTQIRSDEERLINYAKNHEILTLDDAQNTVVDRLSSLNKQLLEAENDRKIAEASYRVKKDPAAAQILAGDAQTQGLQSELTKLKQKRAQLLVDNTEEWPEVQEVNKQIAALEKEIQDARTKSGDTESKAAELKYREALDRENALRAAFEQQRGATRTQNEAAINYKIIQQEIETNKGLLDGLLQRAKENDVILAGTPNNLHVTDYAIAPTSPIGPNRLQGVLLAFLFSIAFGIALAVVLEYLDDSIRSTEDVNRILRLPTLATIPLMKKGVAKPRAIANGTSLLKVNGNGNGHGRNGHGRVNPALLLDLDQRSPLAEAFRQLRTSVLLSTAGHAPKTLVVTSCVPAEGKSTTAINLAVTLAQTGARVLVIDADMRRPTIHSSFGIMNERGLCNVLANDMSEAEILTYIQQETESGLYVLTSGPVPPNPAELLGSEQMQKVLNELKQTFDHIVIDSPPLASFTDGVLLSSICDGVVLVVHANQCSRKVVMRSQQSLEDVGAKIIGVVLNRVDMHSSDYYYGYRYYSNYKSAERSSNEEAPTA
jgi:capsular exopolysaccharide synthesis family protein